MNKKGFSLIELLAVIIVIAIISLFAVPSIINMPGNNDNEQVYETIYLATETYVYNNYDKFKELDTKGSTVEVSILDLINNNYLKSSVVNPKTNEKFTSQDYVLVTRSENMTLSFDLK